MLNTKLYHQEYYKNNRNKMLEYNREWRERNPEYMKNYLEIGNNRELKRERDREDKKIYRKKHPEMRFGRQNWNEGHYKVWKVNFEVYKAIKKGELEKKNCEVCDDKNVHAHHKDYNKVLDVNWFCPLHHKAVHSVDKVKTP